MQLKAAPGNATQLAEFDRCIGTEMKNTVEMKLSGEDKRSTFCAAETA